MSLTAILSFLGSFFSFGMLLFQEFQKRSQVAYQLQQKYVLDQAEFQALVSSVLTRLRMNAAKDSQTAQTMESQVDDSIQDRNKKP